MRAKRILSFLIFLIAIIGLFYYLKITENDPMGIAIDKGRYPVTGIDLSNHSGKVDFESLKTRTLDFVFLKASEGSNFKDKSFERNYKNAKKNGFVLGCYHFYRFETDPIQQASFFLAQIEGKKFDLPLVIDIEEWGNSTSRKPKAIQKDLRRFVDYIESKTKEKLIVYTNESGYRTYVQGVFDDNKIWLCSFEKGEKINNEWLLWQYSHKAKYEEVEGWVDLNTFNGNRLEWQHFLQSMRTK